MQGSTVDAMADAVDNAYCVCYGVSREYKESQNCRLELNYAHQAGKKTHHLRHFILKVINLPRQARDKHRENSK
jgi:hypothetical protein